MTEVTNGVIKMKVLKQSLSSYLDKGWRKVKKIEASRKPSEEAETNVENKANRKSSKK